MALPRINRADLGVHTVTCRKYMQDGEQDVLLALLMAEKPRVMVEIGVNIGLTARAVLHYVTSIELYVGIDVEPSYVFEIPAQEVERPHHPGLLVEHDPRFQLLMRDEIEADSSLMLSHADAVFIDGDHGRNAVLADSLWAYELVQGNGLIIWHDYGNTTVEVTEVLDMLHRQGRNIRHVSGTWLAYER